MAETNDLDTRIFNQQETIERLIKENEKLKSDLMKFKLADSPTTLSERISDLEFKVGRLWKLLTTETPTKETKLSRTGRQFAGQIKNL